VSMPAPMTSSASCGRCRTIALVPSGRGSTSWLWHHPTVLGEGKYVAITDNAEPQMQVVVYAPRQTRSSDQARIGSSARCRCSTSREAALALDRLARRPPQFDHRAEHHRLLVRLGDGDVDDAGPTGMERIDIDPNGKGCTKSGPTRKSTQTWC